MMRTLLNLAVILATRFDNTDCPYGPCGYNRRKQTDINYNEKLQL